MSREVVAEYTYPLGLRKVRYADKSFEWFNRNGEDPGLYGTLTTTPGEIQFVVEGEKDVDTLRGMGLCAVSGPDGAGSWKGQYGTLLAGRTIVILRDLDDPGIHYADSVKRSCEARAQSVCCVDLPGLAEHGDVSDWVAAGGTKDDLIRFCMLYSPPIGARNHTEISKQVSDMSQAFKIDWLAPPFCAQNCLTELHAHEKDGKTLFALWLAGMISEGNSIFGTPIQQRPVLYLHEQPEELIRLEWERLGFPSDAETFFIYRHQFVEPWEATLERIREERDRRGAELIIVDTLQEWSRADSENDSSTAVKVVADLRAFPACLCLRHSRKGRTDKEGAPVGETVQESARGSSAYGGAFDELIRLRRTPGDQAINSRILEFRGRLPTPEAMTIEWDGSTYLNRGEPAFANVNRIAMELFDFLPTGEENAMKLENIREALGCDRTALVTAFSELLTAGTAQRLGTGKKGNPYLYYRSSASTAINAESKPEPASTPIIPVTPSEASVQTTIGTTDGAEPQPSIEAPAEPADTTPSSAGSVASVSGQPDKFGGIPELHGVTCIHAGGKSLCPRCQAARDVYNPPSSTIGGL